MAAADPPAPPQGVSSTAVKKACRKLGVFRQDIPAHPSPESPSLSLSVHDSEQHTQSLVRLGSKILCAAPPGVPSPPLPRADGASPTGSWPLKATTTTAPAALALRGAHVAAGLAPPYGVGDLGGAHGTINVVRQQLGTAGEQPYQHEMALHGAGLDQGDCRYYGHPSHQHDNQASIFPE